MLNKKNFLVIMVGLMSIVFLTGMVLAKESGFPSKKASSSSSKDKKEMTEEDYIKLLSVSKDKKSKIEAINFLRKSKSKKAVNVLGSALKNDENYEVRYNAAIALGEIKEKSSIAVLGEALLNDKNPVVRYSALLSLMCFKDREVIHFFEKAIEKETDPEIKNLLQKVNEKIQKYKK